MKTASIVKIPNKGYIVFGQSKTESGFKIASGPYFNISEEKATSDVIGNAIKTALGNDNDKRVPNPKDWKQFDNDFLKQIGLKSFKELDSSSNKNVLVKEDGVEIIFTPSRPAKKPDKGFLYKDNSQSIKININATNYDIKEAFESALNKCG